MQRRLLGDRKFYIFLALLVVLVIVNVSQWRGSPKLHATNKKGAQEIAKDSGTGDPILLGERLTAERNEFQREKRNIFVFFQPTHVLQASEEEQQEEALPPMPVCGDGACEPGEGPANCPNDCQAPAPPQPVISLRYIGFMAEQGGSVAFLTDGKEVYMGRVNDVIANQYRVLRITEETVELRLLNNEQSSTIRFQGSQGD